MSKCDRCKKETDTTLMSYFNTDILCMECVRIERQHPDFEKARNVELEAVYNGDYNFPGIGLPDDLKGRNNTIMPTTNKTETIKALVAELNNHRHAYYNLNAPTVSDAEYDRAFDQLQALEKETGFVLSNSPTQTVGYAVVSSLEKTSHPIPLLSLDKTKSVDDLIDFLGEREALLMLKLDGLTIKLIYEGGHLIQASTRGDGNTGEVITHNARTFTNLPLSIPYKGRLVVTGEAIIKLDDFEKLKETEILSDGEPPKNARNLAAGTVRQFDAETCAKRSVHFFAFNVLEGLDSELEEYGYAEGKAPNSKFERLRIIYNMGFSTCMHYAINGEVPHHGKEKTTAELLESHIATLRQAAKELHIPIDGMVVTFDDVEYSKSLGRTGHHYRDGFAFKFQDESVETVLRDVEWNVTRSGVLAPVAVFDTVIIDGTDVSRATLHNIGFLTELELGIGNRIEVSKRGAIIPQVEDNLDRGQGDSIVLPEKCPVCAGVVSAYAFGEDEPNGNLNCRNPECPGRKLRKFMHYVSKKAMNIDGLGEEKLRQLIHAGLLKCEADLYFLEQHQSQIVSMEGFGKKSYDKLIAAVEKSKATTMERFIISMDIPGIGRHASEILCKAFDYSLVGIEKAAINGYDFTTLEDFGEVMDKSIHTWFADESNHAKWGRHAQILNILTPGPVEKAAPADSVFTGKTLVATGTLKNFSRDSINEYIKSLGAKAGSSVSKKTDYVIVGENAGSKETKAKELGIRILSEAEFMEMAGA